MTGVQTCALPILPQEIRDEYTKGYEIQMVIPPLIQETTKEEEKESIGGARFKTDNVNESPTAIIGIQRHGSLNLFSNELVNQENFEEKKLYIQNIGKRIGNKLADSFGQVKLRENIGNYLKFTIPKIDHTKSIGYAFELLSEIVKEYNIEDCTLSQIKINKIFKDLLKANETEHDNKTIEVFNSNHNDTIHDIIISDK